MTKLCCRSVPVTKKYAESRRHIHSSRASQSRRARDSTLSEATPIALHMMHGLLTNATCSS